MCSVLPVVERGGREHSQLIPKQFLSLSLHLPKRRSQQECEVGLPWQGGVFSVWSVWGTVWCHRGKCQQWAKLFQRPSTLQEETEIMEDKAHEGRSITKGCFKQWPLLFMSGGGQVPLSVSLSCLTTLYSLLMLFSPLTWRGTFTYFYHNDNVGSVSFHVKYIWRKRMLNGYPCNLLNPCPNPSLLFLNLIQDQIPVPYYNLLIPALIPVFNFSP